MPKDIGLDRASTWTGVTPDRFAAMFYCGSDGNYNKPLIERTGDQPGSLAKLLDNPSFSNFADMVEKARDDADLVDVYGNILGSILQVAQANRPDGCDLPQLVYLRTSNLRITEGMQSLSLPSAVITDATAARDLANPRPSEDAYDYQGDANIDGDQLALSEPLPWSQVVVALDLHLKELAPTFSTPTPSGIGSGSPPSFCPLMPQQDSSSLPAYKAALSGGTLQASTSVPGAKRWREEDDFFVDDARRDSKELEDTSSGVTLASNALVGRRVSEARLLREEKLLRYLVEMKGALGTRSRVFGCLICGSTFEIWMLDPIGVVQSQAVDLANKEGMLEFMLLFYNLFQSTADTLGFDARFFLGPSTATSSTANGFPQHANELYYRLNNVAIRLKDVLHTDWEGVGRSTSVFLTEYEGGAAILKVGYPHVSRPREFTLLEEAEKALTARLGHARGIPTVFGGYSSPATVLEGRPRQLLGDAAALANTTSEDRRHEAILMERLRPLRSLPAPLYTRGVLHIIQTLYVLGNAEILHRDISSNNVMVRCDFQTRTFDGVLADWDHAVIQGDSSRPQIRSRHPAGTYPFIALNLISDHTLKHILRFDLESVVWVYIHDTILWPWGERYGRNEAAVEALDEWSRPSLINPRWSADVHFVGRGRGYYAHARLGNMSGYMKAIRPTMFNLLRKIRNCDLLQVDEDGWLDLNGTFEKESFTSTFRTMAETLERYEETEAELNRAWEKHGEALVDLMPRVWSGWRTTEW